MNTQEIFPKITERAACLFAEDNDFETRYIVAYFEEVFNSVKGSYDNTHCLIKNGKGEELRFNLGHFWRGEEPFKRDITISLNENDTKTFIGLFGGNRKTFLQTLQKKFASFSALADICALLRQENIPFKSEDTLEINNKALRYQFDDVFSGDERLYDSEGNFIIPHIYNPPEICNG